VTPVEFRGDLRRQKTRVPDLSCGVVCVILLLAVLVEHRLVPDGQTDRQTQGHGLYRGCIASRGKKSSTVELVYHIFGGRRVVAGHAQFTTRRSTVLL